MKVTYGPIEKHREYILKSLSKDMDIIDVGGHVCGWSSPLEPFVVDFNSKPSKKSFNINISKEKEWNRVLKYVDVMGKFDYAICTHTIEDISNPTLLLDMLPKIAERGVLSCPSVMAETCRRESQSWNGFIHHRHMIDVQDGIIVIAPKFGFLESLAQSQFSYVYEEIMIEWEQDLPYKMLMDDYYGPNAETVIKEYEKFYIKAMENIQFNK